MLENIFNNPKERTDFIISLVVVLFFGSFILFGSFGNFEGEDISTALLSSVDEITASEIKSEPIAQTVASENYADFQDDDLRSVESIESIELEEIFSNKSPSVAIATNQSSPSEENSKATDDLVIAPMLDRVKETKATVTEKMDSVVTEVKEAEMVKSEPAASTVVPAEKAVVEEDLNCQIVVGAFSSEENRQRLIDALLKDSYVTYTYKQRGLYVASVKAACDEEKLRSTLKTIRKNHASGAFIPNK